MRTEHYAWLGLGAVVTWMVWHTVRRAPVRADAPYFVIGDSIAVGIAAQLRRLKPQADVRVLAATGWPSTMMNTAPDGAKVIVSAGLNDAAAWPPDDAMVASIRRVLGPYASGEAKDGRLFYLLPHSQMGGQLGARATELRRRLGGVGGLDTSRLTTQLPIAAASPIDGIHFTPSGYEALALQALAVLDA